MFNLFYNFRSTIGNLKWELRRDPSWYPPEGVSIPAEDSFFSDALEECLEDFQGDTNVT